MMYKNIQVQQDGFHSHTHTHTRTKCYIPLLSSAGIESGMMAVPIGFFKSWTARGKTY